jgi:hypothetical protein
VEYDCGKDSNRIPDSKFSLMMNDCQGKYNTLWYIMVTVKKNIPIGLANLSKVIASEAKQSDPPWRIILSKSKDPST